MILRDSLPRIAIDPKLSTGAIFTTVPTRIGSYPTPVRRLEDASTERVELWLKDDGRTHADYGGNKVRKLEYALEQAAHGGARRIVTVGAVGSHHVLATTLFAKRRGFEVAALLVPQPRTDHVVANIRAAFGHGLDAWPLRAGSRRASDVAAALRQVRSDDFFLPPGGSSRAGVAGFVAAAAEIAVQVRMGVLPEPDCIFVPLGSGGTAAGLVAGVAAHGLQSTIIAVQVAGMVPAFGVRALARHASRATGNCLSRALARRLLRVETRFLGAGYGHPSPEGRDATARAADLGLALDPTYTAKAFAAALDLARRPGRTPGRESGFVPRNRPLRALYWHTLSSVPAEDLLRGAPRENELPEAVLRLLLPPP